MSCYVIVCYAFSFRAGSHVKAQQVALKLVKAEGGSTRATWWAIMSLVMQVRQLLLFHIIEYSLHITTHHPGAMLSSFGWIFLVSVPYIGH